MVEVSNPDKVIFPDIGFTKTDLVGYHDDVAGLMLPHLRGRPLTLQRFPNGIQAKGFMQKNASSHFPPSIRRVEVPKTDGTVIHPVVDQLDDISYLANQGTVTFHIWASRDDDIHHPDRLVLDLDPEEGDIEGARTAAIATRGVLSDLGCSSGLMTTGSSGYHVVVTLDRSADFDQLDPVARGLAELVCARDPDRFTTEFRKKDRNGRVFIDWLRNRWAQTSVCPWSLRPLPGAPVATPIEWDDLSNVGPRRFTAVDHPDEDPLLGLPVTDANTLCAAVSDAITASGVDFDPSFDRFGRR